MLTVTPATFGDQTLPTVMLSNEPHWIAGQVGAALDYADGGRQLVGLLSAEWSSELLDGRDLVRLEGDALRPLKDLGLVGARASSVILLTESGLYRVLILTGKPVGVRLRDWLTTEVLPSIRRTGSYRPGNVSGGDDGAFAELAGALGLDAVVELHAAERAAGRELPALRSSLRAALARPGARAPSMARGPRTAAQLGLFAEQELDDVALAAGVARVHAWVLEHPEDLRIARRPGVWLGVRAEVVDALPLGPRLREAWARRGWTRAGKDAHRQLQVRVGTARGRFVVFPVPLLLRLGLAEPAITPVPGGAP